MRRRGITAVVILAWIVSAIAQSPTIPAGPEVPVLDGRYHLANCPLLVGKSPRTMSMYKAIRELNVACQTCRPFDKKEIKAYFDANVRAISNELQAERDEVDAKISADRAAVEAKVRADKAAVDARKAAAAAADKKVKDAAATAERHRLEMTPLVRITEAKAREFAVTAATGADNNPTTFQAKFRSLLKGMAPEYSGMQPIENSPGLKIYLAGPLASFEADALQRVRKFEPLTSAAWAPEISILVAPERIDAPDIEKIIVQRNGVVIAPLRSTLALHELATAMNAKRMIHSGSVSYPLDAFLNGGGAMVKVIAIPASGSNIIRTFDAIQLRAIQ